MSSLTLRNVKGSPLTFTEVDNNFSNLNTDKYESGNSPSFANETLAGNLTFSGTARKIIADMDNATLNNRLAFQTSTVNGTTSIEAIPNGTGNSGQFAVWGGADRTNQSVGTFSCQSAGTVSLGSLASGSGTLLPLVFLVGSEAGRILTTRGWTIPAPSSGTAFSITGVSTANVLSLTQGASNANVIVATDGTATAFLNLNGASGGLFGVSTNHPIAFYTNNLARITIAASGGVTFAQSIAVSTGGALIAGGLTVSSGGAGITGTVTGTAFSGDGSAVTGIAAGNIASGTLAAARLSGATAYDITASTVNGVAVGYRAIPRSTTSGTAAVGDVGKCIAITAGLTIPNATFAAGDALSIYNDSAGSLTITQGASLTLRQAGTANTGNRTLALRGMATIWFNSSSEGIITGTGLT